LYAINNQMSTDTGTVMLRATFPNDGEILFPSEFVNVKLLVDTLKNVVLVPTPAVQNGVPGTYVYRVDTDQTHADQSHADQTVSVRKVTLGPSDGQDTVIQAGLAPGDTVVIDGVDRLRDGAQIRADRPLLHPQLTSGIAPHAHVHTPTHSH
jgi:multidrug efflux system membrane fusion protein